MSGESAAGERAKGDTSLDEWREDVEHKLRNKLVGGLGLGERFEDTEQAERFASTVEEETATLIKNFGMGFDQGFGEMRRVRELVLPAHLDSWFLARVTTALARNGYPAEADEVVENEVFILEDEHKAVARFGIAEGYAHQDEIEEAHTQLELAHMSGGGFSEGDLEGLNSAYNAVYQAQLRDLGIPNPVSSE